MLGKHAAINYITKYAAKAESMSVGLDKTILNFTQDQPDSDGIGMILTKTLNRFCIERDFRHRKHAISYFKFNCRWLNVLRFLEPSACQMI